LLEIWYNTNRHRDGRHLAENRTFSYQQIHAHKPLFGNQGKVLNLDNLDFDIVSNFVLRISYFSYRDTLHASRFTKLPFTTVKDSLQIDPFYAKQSQFAGYPNEHNFCYNNEL